MNLKRFTIITAIIMTIIIAGLITLSCIKIDNKLEIADATTFNIYAKSSVPVEYNEEKTPKNYNRALKNYNKSTKISIMECILGNNELRMDPSQDISEPTKYETWKEANKSNFYCFELIFKEKQSVVVNVGGNTKVIEFTGLIMKVEKTRLAKEVPVYFSTSTSDSKSYSSNPILVVMNQTSLYNYIDEIAKVEKD